MGALTSCVYSIQWRDSRVGKINCQGEKHWQNKTNAQNKQNKTKQTKQERAKL